MHKGPIELPDPIRMKCLMVTDFGCLLGIISIDLLPRVACVRDHLLTNKLWIHDLQDLQKLAAAVIDTESLDEILTESVEELDTILELFIEAASSPTRPCGMW